MTPKQAYINNDIHLYRTGDETFRQEFREAFEADHPDADELSFDTWLSNQEVTESDVFFGNDYRQKLKDGIKGVAIASFLAGFILAAFLFTNEEVGAWVRGIV